MDLPGSSHLQNRPTPVESEGIHLFFQLFDQGRYHQSHDVMEDLWRDTPGPERRFFQGLLQCAVSIYHWENRNLHGARILYREGTLKLQPFRPLFFGVDLGAFIERVDRMLPDLVRCSSEKNELPDHRGDNHGTRHSRG